LIAGEKKKINTKAVDSRERPAQLKMEEL